MGQKSMALRITGCPLWNIPVQVIYECNSHWRAKLGSLVIYAMPSVRSALAVRFLGLHMVSSSYHQRRYVSSNVACWLKSKCPVDNQASAILRAWHSALCDIFAEYFWKLLQCSSNSGTVVANSYGSVFHYVSYAPSHVLVSLWNTTVSSVSHLGVLGSGVQEDRAT